MSDLAHHLINMIVPYLQSSIPYLADTRVIMAFTAVLHIVFTSLSTKISFSWNNRNFIAVKFSDPYGPRILKYIYRNHMDKVKRINLSTVNAKKDTIAELRKSISIPYQNNTIYISIEEKGNGINAKISPDTPPSNIDSDSTNTETFVIMFQSYASMKIIKEFIEKIANDNDSDDITEKVIKAHYIRDRMIDKERFVHWVNVDITTNKELKYVFVSDTVQNELIDNIATFMENEQFYGTRGLPYKKSFLLHGPPGCGKTSVIKAISVRYKLPLFIFNIGSLGNKELVSLLFEINEWIKKGEKYIILLEDFDRVLEKLKIYQPHHQDNKLTMDSILNFLDGIDESYGRLTFISANNIDSIISNDALCRPGRINHMVKLDICDCEQIKKIIVNCRNDEKEGEDINDIELNEKDISNIVAMMKKKEKI
jgi:ATP-dependent 26S proteasome regulatory subunit